MGASSTSGLASETAVPLPTPAGFRTGWLRAANNACPLPPKPDILQQPNTHNSVSSHAQHSTYTLSYGEQNTERSIATLIAHSAVQLHASNPDTWAVLLLLSLLSWITCRDSESCIMADNSLSGLVDYRDGSDEDSEDEDDEYIVKPKRMRMEKSGNGDFSK